MFELFQQPGFFPFSVAATMVFGLLFLEILLFSLVGITSHIGEIDIGGDIDAGMGSLDAPSMDALSSLDAADLDGIAPIQTEISGPEGAGGWLEMTGLGYVPSAIWLAAILAFFAMVGFFIQGVLNAFGINPLPSVLASAIAIVPAFFLTSRYAKIIGRLVPSHETASVSENAFHQRKGRLIGGDTMRGKPRETEWTDGYGNKHFLLAEPLDDDETIVNQSQVLLLRTDDGKARLISLSS